MATRPLNNIWIRRQQCPCGDWKCYIKYEGDDQVTAGSELVKSEITSSSSSSSEVVFTPYVGQIFKSDDEAFEYYSNFARKNGFSIRKARSTESQNLGIYRRDFVCYRSGFNQPRKKANVEHPRDRKSVRCGCDAKLYLTKEIVDGIMQWYVSQFSSVHNHELLEDDQVRLLPAYRKIQEPDQERILLLSKAGFPVNRIVKVLELEKGVQPGQLPFIEKDVRNFVRTCKKTVQENDALLTEKRETDMLELVEACKATAHKDEGFVFVQFMRGGRPETVVTNIDSGLRDAIAIELPNTKHVMCLWRVLSKLPSWFSLPLGLRYADFKSEFEMLCHLEDVEDFEHQWNHLVARFGLGPDKHIALLFSYRASWPFSYIRGYFLARTLTAEYSKSVETFLKSILSPQSSLQFFFEQVGMAANPGIQERERQLYMPIKTCLPLEEHARNLFTPYAFYALQHEIVLAMQYAITEMAKCSYLVRHHKKLEGEYLVIWIPEEEQHSGILCRHSLRVLVTKNYFQIPEKYFPHRWRLESNIVPLDYPIVQDINDECSQAFHSLSTTLLSESLMSKERFNFLHRELTQLLDQVRNMPDVNEVG
ncbi:hypothetical protein RJ639_046344 [Escallonia herrerae]|uniref:Protein FAR1-RELATED SEQUENCE n=1 Tax=Escallonia herrerae TaxID=1293975 RepID=A0AA89AZ00_9ASTE|nr:hypothetical protein RJ639_046344 [Escallonia herrerae]